MQRDIKKKTKEYLWIFFCALLYILLQGMIIHMQQMQLTVFNGVFTALQYGTCLLMLKANRRGGIVVSIVLMSFSIAHLLFLLVIVRVVNLLPGMLNMIFYLVTFFILARFYRKQEKESVTDVLTGVLNRRGLYKYLQDKLANDEDCSLIYICLDNFKSINDTYGHACGDELMRKLTHRMGLTVGDEGCVARIGGAEFVVVTNDCANAENIANTLLEIIREKTSIEIEDTVVEFYLTSYAGLASYPSDAEDYEALIKNADIAMFEATSTKSKTARVFDQSMADYMNRQIEVERLIKEGLKKDYFYLVYQPQYLFAGRRLRGFETLIRMKTPDGKVISPSEFIPVAEKSDLILQIDDYVLKRAMLEFKDVVAKNPDLMISVNVSAKNIGNRGFIDKLTEILDSTGFPPSNLEIEITEYCMVESMNDTTENIVMLRALGVQIALDDFGTGYTSLSYVSKLPINLLKVDKSLIDDIVSSDKSRKFVQIVISMGHLMGCEVIAEGVEDETQLDYLEADECNFVQGYVWGRPLDYNVAVDLATK